jgi:AcrR family transcriptional regulator
LLLLFTYTVSVRCKLYVQRKLVKRNMRPNAKTRTPLSKERVLQAAVALADEEGIEGLSMRRLADELGVKAMSLYNHVANKDELLAGIVDAVWGEIALPTVGADWKTQIRELAVSAHEASLRHPWASTLTARHRPGPKRFRYGNSLLGCFRDSGFSKELTYHAYHIIESYILGFTFQVLSYRNVDMEQFSGVAESFMRGEFLAEYPHFTEHVQQHIEPDPGQDDVNAYVLGLDLMLDGLEQLRDAA